MDDDNRHWRWRNLREAFVSVGVLIFPWQWRFHWEVVSPHSGWHAVVIVGPLVVRVEADHGNCSTGDWRARFGLSEIEAWERSE